MMHDMMVVMTHNVVVIHVTHKTAVAAVVYRGDRRRWCGWHRVGLLGRRWCRSGRWHNRSRRRRWLTGTGAEKRQNAGNGD